MTLSPLVLSIVLGQHHAPETKLTAELSLKALAEGNARFVDGRMIHWAQDSGRRKLVAEGQKPHTIVFTCADSRVPPEIVFDQGLGHLFVVRVAGNVADTDAIASIEYAAEHLGTPLLVVLGHQKCGAVAAALDVFKSKAAQPGAKPAPGGHGKEAHQDSHAEQAGSDHANIAHLVEKILPACASTEGRGSSHLDEAIKTNVQNTIDTCVAHSPMLKEMVFTGKLQIVGGVYSLETGRADLWQPYKPVGGYVRVRH